MRKICLFLLVVVVSSTTGQIGFFDQECPDGWEAYPYAMGRTIIGAGSYSSTRLDGAAESRSYFIGQVGGEMDHKLITGELPEHDHAEGEYAYLLRSNCQRTTQGSDYTCGEPDILTAARMRIVGNNFPHNNMQPFLALKACKKLADVITTNSSNATSAYQLSNGNKVYLADDNNHALIGIILGGIALFIQFIRLLIDLKKYCNR